MTSSMPYEHSPSAGVSSPGSASQGYDYASAIDPALEGAGASNDAFGPSTGMPQFHQNYKGERQSASHLPFNASNALHMRGGASSPPLSFHCIT